MSEKMIENNRVSVIGEIVSGFTFSHEVFGEGFYMVDVAVNRLSEQADIIPLMISERLIDVHKDYSGSTVESIGQFRSYNRHEGIKNRLMLSIFVREIHFIEEFTDYTQDQSDIPGRLYLQAAYIQKDSSWTGNRRYSSGCEPPLRQIRLHTLHQLGTQRAFCFQLRGRHQGKGLGPCAEPRVH